MGWFILIIIYLITTFIDTLMYANVLKRLKEVELMVKLNDSVVNAIAWKVGLTAKDVVLNGKENKRWNYY